jgi:hypothetical protein
LAKDAYFTSPRIVLPRDPPLLLKPQISLKEVEEICARHSTTSKEVSAHPPHFKVIRGGLVSENMHEEFPSGLQCSGNLGHEEFIIFHMLE